MVRKVGLLLMALIIALSVSACDSGSKKNAFNTDSVKKFVENSKKKGTMPNDKVRKALKSIFPKMKLN